MSDVYEQILEKITAFHNEPFTLSDFKDIARYEVIKKNLQRLKEKNLIYRLKRGMYYAPRYLTYLGEYSHPSINSIGEALARQNGWTITPSENESLNLLGLSTQVPSSCEFLSTGPYYESEFSGNKITYKHASSKYVSSSYSKKTMLVINAIRGLGKDNITSSDISIIRSNCSKSDLEALKMEGVNTSVWIYEVINKIGGEFYA
ncbi:MAG: DUF6088 family protein [Coprobacillus sp.]|nr:DUF6088 family protein [Coprobacillus sp.]